MAKSHRPNPKRPNASRIDKPSEIPKEMIMIHHKDSLKPNEANNNDKNKSTIKINIFLS